VGFLPVFFPPEGCLRHASIHTQPFPVDTLPTVILEESGLPKRQKHAVGHPLLEAVVGSGPWAELRRVQGLPLATGPQNEENGLHAHPVGCAWPTTTETMCIHVLREVDCNLDPEIIGDAPLFGNEVRFHGLPS
jgi:hypothetical protein